MQCASDPRAQHAREENVVLQVNVHHHVRLELLAAQVESPPARTGRRRRDELRRKLPHSGEVPAVVLVLGFHDADWGAQRRPAGAGAAGGGRGGAGRPPRGQRPGKAGADGSGRVGVAATVGADCAAALAALPTAGSPEAMASDGARGGGVPGEFRPGADRPRDGRRGGRGRALSGVSTALWWRLRLVPPSVINPENHGGGSFVGGAHRGAERTPDARSQRRRPDWRPDPRCPRR